MKTLVSLFLILLLTFSTQACQSSWDELWIYSYDGNKVRELDTITTENFEGGWSPIFSFPANETHMILQTGTSELSLVDTRLITSSSETEDAVVFTYPTFPLFWKEDESNSPHSPTSGVDCRSYISVVDDTVYFYQDDDIWSHDLLSGKTTQLINMTTVLQFLDQPSQVSLVDLSVQCNYGNCIMDLQLRDTIEGSDQHLYLKLDLVDGSYTSLTSPSLDYYEHYWISPDGQFLLTSTVQLSNRTLGQIDIWKQHNGVFIPESSIIDPELATTYKIQVVEDLVWFSMISPEDNKNGRFRAYELHTGGFLTEFSLWVEHLIFFETVVINRRAAFDDPQAVPYPTMIMIFTLVMVAFQRTSRTRRP